MNRNYLRYRVGQWVSYGLSRRRSIWLAERLADLQCRWSARDRAIIRHNLQAVLGTPVPEGAPLVRDVFRHFGRYLVEFFNAHRGPAISVTVEGRDRIRPSSIVLSAHVGNWELGAILLRRLGLPVSIVVLPHRDPDVNQLFDRQRVGCGVRVLPLGPRITTHCLELLRDGWAIGIMGDRDFSANGIPVQLFGRMVRVPRGPAVLSLRSGLPVVPVFCVRERPWEFRLFIVEPFWPTRGLATSENIRALTQQYTTVIGRYVQRFPTQWLMFEPLGQALRQADTPWRAPVPQEAAP